MAHKKKPARKTEILVDTTGKPEYEFFLHRRGKRWTVTLTSKANGKVLLSSTKQLYSRRIDAEAPILDVMLAVARNKVRVSADIES
jgi:hypothetical protein